MAEFDYDLFTIGAGSGGVRASRVAAALGGVVHTTRGGRLSTTGAIGTQELDVEEGPVNLAHSGCPEDI